MMKSLTDMDPFSGPANRRAVLLLAHGTPESADQIPEYLRNITHGRPLPQEAIEEVRRRYTLAGQSPLTRLTLEQGKLLERELGMPVYVGMRNWTPYIATAIARMVTEGVTQAAAICLAPQNSRTSVGLYRQVTMKEVAGRIDIEFVESWAAHPGLAQAFAERLAPVWSEAAARAGRAVPVLFTAHSVPCRTIQSNATAPGIAPVEPDPYAVEAKRTAAQVAGLLSGAGLEAKDWYFAFQSQGMSGGPWIGPTVEDTLHALRDEGHRAVVIQPVGFLTDHVEILYDIDIAFRELGEEIGLEVLRVPSLNGSSRLIATLADLARRAFARLESRISAAAGCISA